MGNEQLKRQRAFIDLAADAGVLEMHACISKIGDSDVEECKVWLEGPYKDNYFSPQMNAIADEISEYLPELIDFVSSQDSQEGRK